MLPLRCHPAEVQWPPTYPGCSWSWRRLRPEVAANLDLRKPNAEALKTDRLPRSSGLCCQKRAVWANGTRSQHNDEGDDPLRWYAA